MLDYTEERISAGDYTIIIRSTHFLSQQLQAWIAGKGKLIELPQIKQVSDLERIPLIQEFLK